MKSIPKEQILRLNCPGYGEESFLTIGKAKPLDQYSVIVVNPVSILHLFDKDAESIKEINGYLEEGLTSYTLKNDALLQTLENDLKKRIFELVSFLEKGGLLVYFLCRPFLVQGSKTAMDNYYWLESLAPDTPTETNVRHMSAVSHGRIIEPTEHAGSSDFADYFKQPGLEWNTIIREDNLTEGYIVLCTAGPRKCIAAQLIAGDNDGRIVFLPAPYSPDFDKVLVDCLTVWYNERGGEVAEAGSDESGHDSEFPQPDPNKFLAPKMSTVGATAPAASVTAPEKSAAAGGGGGSAWSAPGGPKSGAPAEGKAAASQSKSGLPPVQKFDQKGARPQNTSTGDHEAFSQDDDGLGEDEGQSSGYVHPADQKREEESPAPMTLFEQMAAQQDNRDSDKSSAASAASAAKGAPHPQMAEEVEEEEEEPIEEHEEFEEPEEQAPPVHIPQPKVAPVGQAAAASSNNNHDVEGQSKDLIKKMEEISSKTQTPAWCIDFTFPDLEDLRHERTSLTDSIRQTQAKIAALESKIALLDGLKNALLSAEGEDLTIACSRVFKRLGWQPKPSETDKSELMLSQDKPEIIARVSRSTNQAKRSDLVELSQSVINFWGETEIEPKGLLITCTWANRPPAERTDADYQDSLVDFAEKKNLCLMTTMQLLSMYRDLELGKVAPEEIRRRILETSGRLSGYGLESAMSRA